MVMELTLETVVNGASILVVCRGRLVHGTTARALRACTGRLLRRHPRIALDLAEVTHIDAGGVGVLAALLVRAKSTNRRLVVTKSSARVQRLLQISGLDVHLQDESLISGEIRAPGADLFVERRRAATVRARPYGRSAPTLLLHACDPTASCTHRPRR